MQMHDNLVPNVLIIEKKLRKVTVIGTLYSINCIIIESLKFRPEG